MSTGWMEVADLATESPTPADVRAYFGVPPDPEEKLDANIERKRRAWKKKVREQKANAVAKAKVAAVTELITFLAEYVKRGVDEPLDLSDLREAFRHAPQSTVGELGDLWRVLEDLLASGELDEALKVANEARARFADEPVAHGAFAWVAGQASRSLAEPTERLRLDGLESAQKAIAGGMREADVFSARAGLQLDLGRGADALAGLREAEQHLGADLPAIINGYYVEAFVAVGDVDGATTRALEAVEAAPDDLALRSGLTFSLVMALRQSLLPISSKEALADYNRVAGAAAWCAIGAPEAEDAVRPYRLWGVVADNRIYTGDVAFRAFAAVVTGFLLLPFLNRVRSKPQWRVFHEGPDSASEDVFAEVALSAIAGFVHEGLTDRLPWWAEFQQQIGA